VWPGKYQEKTGHVVQVGVAVSVEVSESGHRSVLVSAHSHEGDRFASGVSTFGSSTALAFPSASTLGAGMLSAASL
jgi:hypothetical protein